MARRPTPQPGLLAAALLLSGATAVVAERAAQQPTFRTGVDVIQLDVTVLDANRQPVRGLTAADFTVTEGGKRLPIVGVVPVELPPAPPLGIRAAWTRAVASDVVSNELEPERTVVIIMDDGNTGTSDKVYDPRIAITAKQIARDVVTSLGARDLAAVVFTFKGRSQNLTGDREKLLAAIESFTPRDVPAPYAPRGAVPIISQRVEPLGCYMPMVGFNCQTDTLEGVAKAMPPMPPRRKLIVFISQDVKGFDVQQTCDGSPLALPDSAALSSLNQLGRALRALQEANVSVYAFDPSGLQVDRRQFCAAERLRALAEMTGGRALSQTNEPWTGVPAVMEETSSYYLVGFRTDRTDGLFHRVAVRVNRPGVEVRTRAGYTAPSAKPPRLANGKTPPSPVELALASSIPSGDLKFAVSAAVLPAAGRRESDVAVVTHLNLPASNTPFTTRLVDVLVTAFDRTWKARDSHRQTAQVITAALQSGAVAVEVRSQLALPPGRYELRIAAESAGVTGSVFTDLEIPDTGKERVSLSSLVFEAATTGASTAGEPRPAMLMSAPTVRRTFGAGDRVTAFLRVYQGGKETLSNVPLSVRIEDELGALALDTHVELVAEQFLDRSADYRLALPLRTLPAGEYVLTMTIEDEQAMVRRNVRFRVERR